MNDVMDIDSFEQRVRDRAYALWENEGRPVGRDAEHWRLSEEATLAEMMEAVPMQKVAKSKATSRKKASAKSIGVEMSASH